MINFSLPGLWEHFNLNQFLIEFIKNNPEAKKENININAVYGSFPYSIWDGGRIFYNNFRYASLERIVQIREYLANNNISLRLIFTNPVLNKEHFLDRFCNLVCITCEDEKNEIVINNNDLEDYLRNKYQKFSFISSTTKCNTIENSVEEIEKDKYKFVCLDYNNNHKLDILNNLNQNEKNKIEFLCNAICPPGCPTRKEHYRLNGLFYLNYLKEYKIPECQIGYNTLHPNVINYKNNISPEEINDYYLNGFSYFKLEGRTLEYEENLLNYARYLIKPEWQYYFILEGIKNKKGTE